MATELANVIEQTLVQEIEPGILESLPMEDPIWPDILRTSVGVVRDPKGMGRDFLIQKVYRTGVGGAGHWGSIGGGDVLDTEAGTPTGVRVLDTPRTYPAHNEGTSSEFVTVQGQLIKFRGNIHMDESVMLANELDASIGDVVGLKIKDAAKKFSSSLTHAFYALASQGTSNDIDNSLGVVGTTHTDPDDSGNAAVVGDSAVTLNIATGQLANFFPGQMLELWAPTGTTRRHAVSATLRTAGDSWLIVDAVDRVGGTVTLRLHGGGTFDSEVAADDILIPMRDPTANASDITNDASGNAKGLLPYGLNDWIKTSGLLFNENAETGLDLAKFPQFKSVTGTISGVLTETDLNLFFGRFWHFYGGHVSLDTILMTMGVLNGYMTGVDGQFQYQRNNMTLKTHAGWEEFDYTLNGKNFSVRISRGLEAGAVVALGLRNGNLKMFVPPKVNQGFGSDSRFPPLIEFVNPGGSIFKMYHVQSVSSEVREAPFRSFLNILPDDPQAIKLTGATESI